MLPSPFIVETKKQFQKSYTAAADKTWPVCHALKRRVRDFSFYSVFLFFATQHVVAPSPAHLFFCCTFLPKPTVQSELTGTLAADVPDGVFSQRTYVRPTKKQRHGFRSKSRSRSRCVPAAPLRRAAWPLTPPTVSVSTTVSAHCGLMNLMKFWSASPSSLKKFFFLFFFKVCVPAQVPRSGSFLTTEALICSHRKRQGLQRGEDRWWNFTEC